MARQQKSWVYTPPRSPAPKVPASAKSLVQQKADELLERVLKPTHIQPPPAPGSDQAQFNYIVDLYTKWYRHYFYFCAKYCVPGPGALAPFFEAKFARLEYLAPNRFNLAFVRYTNEWVEIYSDITLEECLAALETDPFFHP